MICKLGDIADLITKGTTPKKYIDNPNTDSIIFLRAENIDGTIIGDESFKYIDATTHEKELKRSILQENDILITIAGSLGRTAKITNKHLPANTNQAVAIVRITKKDVDIDYVLYYLRRPLFMQNAIAASAQSVQPNLNLQQIADLEIELPSFEEQQKIAKTLRSFDNLIEHNSLIIRKLNNLLWNFYKKMISTQSAVELKEGWKLVKLGQVTSNNREKVGSKKPPVFSALNTGILIPSTEHFTKQVFSKDISKYIIVKHHDFAYNPARINIGSLGINDYEYEGCVSPVYVAFSVDKEYINFFRYYLKSDPFKEEVKSRASGSVRQTLNYSDFALIELPYPPVSIIKTFNEQYNLYMSSINQLKSNNEKIIKLRDLVLSKLFAGDFDLSKLS